MVNNPEKRLNDVFPGVILNLQPLKDILKVLSLINRQLTDCLHVRICCFSVLCRCEINIFKFWIVGWTKQAF